MPISAAHPETPSSADQPQLTFLVAGMTCSHCEIAVAGEVAKVENVHAVDVDLDTKLVSVHGAGVDPAAVVAAIDEAGYDAVAA